jgi:hypothetical protein
MILAGQVGPHARSSPVLGTDLFRDRRSNPPDVLLRAKLGLKTKGVVPSVPETVQLPPETSRDASSSERPRHHQRELFSPECAAV